MDGEYVSGYSNIILGVILIISISISFRDNIQQVESINKLFRYKIFKIILLIAIILTNNIIPQLGIPLVLLYLSLNTYIHSLPKSEELKQEIDSSIKQEDKKEAFSDNKKKLNGEQIAKIIDTINTNCNGDNENSETCKYLMSKYSNINEEVLNMSEYEKNHKMDESKSSDEVSIKDTIEKYKNIF